MPTNNPTSPALSSATRTLRMLTFFIIGAIISLGLFIGGMHLLLNHLLFNYLLRGSF